MDDNSRGFKRALAGIALLFVAASSEAQEQRIGDELSLSDKYMTFHDEFDRPSISDLDGKGPWFAGTGPQFGHAAFVPYVDRSQVYRFEGGKLTINMISRNGLPISGLIQSVDENGAGFAQSYGYFEVRARFPDGESSWPAFWLKSIDEYRSPDKGFAEVDVVENFNSTSLRRIHNAVLTWLPDKHASGKKPRTSEYVCNSSLAKDPAAGSSKFHTYGVELSPDWILFFYDRRMICRIPALSETRRPMFMLIDLAYRGESHRESPPIASMTVDYVRVWQRRPVD